MSSLGFLLGIVSLNIGILLEETKSPLFGSSQIGVIAMNVSFFLLFQWSSRGDEEVGGSTIV